MNSNGENNMAIKVAINGFGRIGRTVMRSAITNPEVEVVAVNDRMEPKLMGFLFKHDSVHGPFQGTVEIESDALVINGKRVRALNITDDLLHLPWADLKIDIVLECTGLFSDKEKAGKHIQAGAKKVVISAPGKKVDATIVMGVNDETYDPANHNVVSNASCTTNCLAPPIKVLLDEFGVEKGLMTTIHSYTMDQSLLDTVHKDYRRARAAAMNMIPTTTGAASAIGLVIPELAGKLDGLAIRVPTPNVSLVDLSLVVKKSATVEQVNSAIKKAADGKMKKVLRYMDEPLVSTDFINSPYSSIFDAPSTMTVGANMIKILAWYDNEAGYSARMVDLAVMMGKKLI
jgi:glyceraldehyde 3-phosphate dehydrogenase